MKTILGVIPARGGSKGVPRKNIAQLCGKPLIEHIFESARRSKYINRLVLSTEDDEIAQVARSKGIEVPFMRPFELATDTASSISVIKHALRYFDDSNLRFDGVISLQPTNPFTTTETIDRAIKLWLDTGCDSITTVSEVTRAHPYITKRFKPGNIIESFCVIPEGVVIHQRQSRERAYYMTGAIYVRSRELIEAENMDEHYLGSDARAVVVDETEAHDINSELDLELAEWIMMRTRKAEAHAV
jgi:N-acylneuraminate cytidylyltransferase/CMP-N,N'-diacetyllegionaminic acid synthase